jgi:hypothetical protein
MQMRFISNSQYCAKMMPRNHFKTLLVLPTIKAFIDTYVIAVEKRNNQKIKIK